MRLASLSDEALQEVQSRLKARTPDIEVPSTNLSFIDQASDRLRIFGLNVEAEIAHRTLGSRISLDKASQLNKLKDKMAEIAETSNESDIAKHFSNLYGAGNYEIGIFNVIKSALAALPKSEQRQRILRNLPFNDLQKLIEGGLVKFIAWFVFYMAFGIYLLKNFPTTLAFFCAYIALSIEGLLENWWGDSEVLGLFVLLMVLAVKKSHRLS